MSPQTTDYQDSLVICQTSSGVEFRANPLRLTRHAAVFEIYSPTLVLRASEVLEGLNILLGNRILYMGRGVVRGLVTTGAVTVCEVALEDNWRDVEFTEDALRNGKLREQFQTFLRDWQKVYRVEHEYKVIIADMQSFFSDLRLWLDQVEIGIRSSPSGDRLALEQFVAEELAQPVIPCINLLFERFEAVAQNLPEELLPAHRYYMRRQLHPYVLCSPFAYRTYQKPLGYAGDYEMVNMLLRNNYEGGSLFAKVVNTWFLRQPPAQAHRNRIDYLIDTLRAETLRVMRENRPARILCVACGPAHEVQRFLGHMPLSERAAITLLDFNEETLQYARAAMETLKQKHGCKAQTDYVRKSVQQILKESGRSVQQAAKQYDLVYCAGLYDYLSDPICQRLTSTLYEWVAPGGLALVTNVEPSNPLRNGMDHLLDWHLIYRTATQMRKLIPVQTPADAAVVRSEETGLNLFLELRKPAHE
jgi:extracellular factor (EF) 3-hydroxypalmitic acid methyl ester biosynthesis protein